MASKHIPRVHLEMYGMRAVDTVGCGDAFLAVLSALKAEGVPDAEALKKASATRAFKATKAETKASPTRRKLHGFFRRVKSTFSKNIR